MPCTDHPLLLRTFGILEVAPDGRTLGTGQKTRSTSPKNPRCQVIRCLWPSKSNTKMAAGGPSSHVDLVPLLAELEEERALSEAIRAKAKDVDAVQRQIQAALNRVHSTQAGQVPALVLSFAPLFAQLRQRIAEVIALVPENQFWKWNDCWSFSLQRAAYGAALAWWLTTGRLISKPETEQMLGCESNRPSDQIHPLSRYADLPWSPIVQCRRPPLPA